MPSPDTQPTSQASTLTFFVNGKRVDIPNPDPEITLLECLRRQLRLTGSKLGCGEGGCGACTVMVSRYDPQENALDMHGLSVTTVEGIGNVRDKLHPVQRQLAESHGSQCGFCTPGFIMSMYCLLRNNPRPSQEEMEHAFDGNLCRCTGYRPILEGFKAFTESPCGLGSACCRNNGTAVANGCNGVQNGTCNGGQADDHTSNEESNGTTPTLTYDPSQDVIFPPELKLASANLHGQSLTFNSAYSTWLRPASISELVNIRKQHPDCKLVCGNTEIGIEIKAKRQPYPVMVSVSKLTELTQVQHTDRGIKIGACLTLDKVDSLLKKAIKELPEHKSRVFAAFVEMLRWFAGHQIRSVACLAGNIVTASPISDFNPLFLACKAVVEVIDSGKTSTDLYDSVTDGVRRNVVMDEKFFTGYRQTCLNKTDTVVSVLIPYTGQNEYFFGYKQANRKEDDISVVNAGMRVDLGKDGSHIDDITLAFGGMAVKTVMALKTMAGLKGRKWDRSLLELAFSEDMLPSDLPLAPGAPGGTVAFRRTLTHSFFFRFFLNVSEKLDQVDEIILEQDRSAIGDISRQVSHGSQVYQMPSDLQSPRDYVGRPIIHQSAYQQTTGEAVYVDDIPVSHGELHAGYVLSSKAHAKILKVDASEALSIPGVVDFVTYKDVPGNNNWLNTDDLVFAEDEVMHEGQVIAVVLADSLSIAQRAACRVQVTYEDIEPIITIQEAIAKESYYNIQQKVSCGDVEAGMKEADYVSEGEVHVEAQEHFYLEPQACIVYPKDWDEYQVVCATQGLDCQQTALARALGLPMNQINVCVKRLGGGFGGKETRHSSLVLPTAVAAYKTHRPVRSVFDREEDMRVTGTRHPALAKYKVAFNADGTLVALDITVYLNAGSTLDVSHYVSDRCLLNLSGSCYRIPNLRAENKLCRTNIASRTAFRGFGSPQAWLVLEDILDRVVSTVGRPPHEVRQRNFLHDGEFLGYGKLIVGCTLEACWSECQAQSHYQERLQEVEAFNKTHRWKKRGIALMPLTYGVGFTGLLKNKGAAVVSIYRDGSVLILTGGIEMGQGLHTKLIQVASRALDVPVQYIRVGEPTSNGSASATATAASFASDLHGMAVLKACEELNKRLAPHRAAAPKKEWRDLANDAIDDREYLTACGYFKPDMEGVDWSKKINNPFLYFSYGAGCSEVEIDCLTGDHQVLRTDIVMDVGQSLNPAIDVGQIEGAFVQGYGMMVLEQYKMSRDGRLLGKGPGAYKIPTAGNIPQAFHVTLLKSNGNPKAVYSSKAIGEPPLILATSVVFAIKSAIQAARKDAGLTGYFRLDTPATPDKIRMACMDHIAQQFVRDAKQDEAKSWFVQL